MLRPLLFLPEDVLIEVLTHLLVDTPRFPHKAGVLRTCSLLHALGLPLLYRVVDLRGFRSALDALALWEGLLGPGGSLTKDGRVPELGASVVELRLGLPGMKRKRERLRVAQQTFIFGPVHLPRCTTLVYSDAHLAHFHNSRSFVSFLASLPVAHLVLQGPPVQRGIESQTLLKPMPSFLLDHTLRLWPNVSRLWPNLDTVRMVDTVWCQLQDDGEGMTRFSSRIGLSQWHIRTLVIKLPREEKSGSGQWLAKVEGTDLFLAWGDLEGDATDADGLAGPGEERWAGLERVEIRVSREIEAELRRKVDDLRKEGPLGRSQRRILPVMVFVDEDGTERRLIKDGEII